MQEQALRIALVTWIRSIYGPTFPVIFDWQPYPESPPFVAFRIGDTESKSYDTQLGVDNLNLMHVGGLRQSTITISYFGFYPEASVAINYAMQNACRISNSLELTTVQRILGAAGFAYLHKNPVQNLTYPLESKYQPRADFDFYLGFAEQQTEDIGTIERVTVTGTSQDVVGNVLDVVVENIPN